MTGLRPKLVHQIQPEDERYAYCGMYSINNAAQERDLLNSDMMREHLQALERTCPGVDHGDPDYGAYTIQCMQNALQSQGWYLYDLTNSKTFKCASQERLSKVVSSGFKRLIVIGRYRIRWKATTTASLEPGSRVSSISWIRMVGHPTHRLWIICDLFCSMLIACMRS